MASVWEKRSREKRKRFAQLMTRRFAKPNVPNPLRPTPTPKINAVGVPLARPKIGGKRKPRTKRQRQPFNFMRKRRF